MLRDRVILSFFGLSAALVILSILFIFLGLGRTSGELILSFDSEGKIKFIGNFWTAIAIFMVALGILLINFALASEVYNRERFLSYILGAGSLFFSILVLILSWFIVSVN